MIALIAAAGRSAEGTLVIGIDGRMPWNIPEDLHHFRDLTMGHTVLMGRRTFESIGKPLQGRRNIVLTHNKELCSGEPHLGASHKITCHSVRFLPANDNLFELASLTNPNSDTLFVIGGGTVYEQFIGIADRIYLTLVDGLWEGDTFFPAIDPTRWRLTSREPHKGFEYLVYDRINN